MGKYNGSPYNYRDSDTPRTDKVRVELRGKPVEEVWKYAEQLEREATKVAKVVGFYCSIPSPADMRNAMETIIGTPKTIVEVAVEFCGGVREMSLRELAERLGFHFVDAPASGDEIVRE